MNTQARTTLFIVDGSIAVTGALDAAARQAELMQEEVETILVLPAGHRVPASRTAAFAEVLEAPIVNLRKSLASVLLYVPALVIASIRIRSWMRRRGSERLQLNDFYLLHGAMLRLFGFRGRIVTWVRIDPTRFGLLGKFWLVAARWCSTDVVAVSRFIQGLLEPNTESRVIYGPSSSRVGVINPCPRQTPLFLFVGNYIEGKGQEDAIAAFHHVGPRYPEARLRFVGGDMGLAKNRAFREALEHSAAIGPVPGRIEFRGHSDDLTADYAEAFAALNFSASESFSNTCLDASAAGLPVVATRCGGPEEIIDDDVTGFLVPVGDVTAMVERMAWLLDHPFEAKRMGEAGRRLVADRFSPSVIAAELKMLFVL